MMIATQPRTQSRRLDPAKRLVLFKNLLTCDFPYQLRWLGDDAQKRIVVKGRGTGFTHLAARECLLDTICGPPNCTSLYISLTQKHSNSVLDYMDAARTDLESDPATRPLVKGVSFNRSNTNAGVKIPWNNSKILPLSSNVDAARGLQYYLCYLDEFAMQKSQEQILEAVSPQLNLPFPDGTKRRLSIISTPNGSNLFEEIYENASEMGYSSYNIPSTERHKLFPEDHALHYPLVLNDPPTPREKKEYLCSFQSPEGAHFTEEFVRSMFYTSLPEDADQKFLYLGWDPASNDRQDRSVAMELTRYHRGKGKKMIVAVTGIWHLKHDHMKQIKSLQHVRNQTNYSKIGVEHNGNKLLFTTVKRVIPGIKAITTNGEWKEDMLETIHMMGQEGTLQIPHPKYQGMSWTMRQEGKRLYEQLCEFDPSRPRRRNQNYGHFDHVSALMLSLSLLPTRLRVNGMGSRPLIDSRQHLEKFVWYST